MPPPPSRSASKATLPPRRALGRGLSSLLPSVASVVSDDPSKQTGLRLLAIEKIVPNKEQPRKHFDAAALGELAASIETQGILQPVVVRRVGDRYELVAGERRWRAAQMAGLQAVPALIKELSDERALQVALIENIQRRDLDPLEEAMAYQRLLDEHALRHEDVAKAVGKTRTAITHSLRLLRMPEQLVTLVAGGQLSPGHARAVLALEKNSQRKQLAEEIVSRDLSVAGTLVRVKEMQRALKKQQGKTGPKSDVRSLSVRDLEEKWQRAIGQKVRIVVTHEKGQRGRVEIAFDSFEQLERIGECVLS